MEKLSTDIQNLKLLYYLDLSDQRAQQTSIASTIKFRINLPPALEVLNLSRIMDSSYISGTYLELSLRNINKLKFLSLKGNGIDVISSPFIEKPNRDIPLELDFDQNRLQSLGFLEAAIRRGLKLRSLRLNGNRLGMVGGGSVRGRLLSNVFQNNTHLEILDLSANYIKEIPEDGFVNLKHLRKLYLNKNTIDLILFEFSHMVNLSLLDLSNNSITEIHAKTLDMFVRLRERSQEFKLNIRGNRLDCSCSSLTFVRWIFKHEDIFKDFDAHSCVYNGSMVKLITLKTMLPDIEFECSLKLALKVSAGLLASFSVITLFAVGLYRHRWEVRFCCIKFIAKRKFYEELEESRNDYKYDAFVAYHRDDYVWVRDELYEKLDQKEDGTNDPDRFRLCIHDRDFTPGTSIEDNIVRAIENSRKTIIVLSAGFLTSEWCDFELHMARMESFDKGRNLIIVVMLECLPADKMSKSLRMLIKRNTYIEWFEDPVNKSNFWEKLRSALAPEI